jgi:hypothetical protein
VWPKLNEPERRFNPEGVFVCKLRFKPSEAGWQKFMADFERFEEECFEWAKGENPKKKLERAASALTPVLDEDGNPTGEMELQAKLQAKVTVKSSGKSWEQRPVIFDTKQQVLMPEVVLVGGGSVLQMEFEARAYLSVPRQKGEPHLVGASRKLRSVMVWELKTYSKSQSAAERGYDTEGDEGYEFVPSSEQQQQETY